jgi:GNAT superfamily N-acetyltransferase
MMAPGVQVRPLESGDKQAVLDICEKVWGADVRAFTDAMWDWKLARAAAAADPVRQSARVVIEAGRVVGYSGLVPARFCIDGDEVQGGAVMDSYVDPDARGAGTKLVKVQLQDSGLCYGLAVPRMSRLSARIQKREDITLMVIDKRFLFLDPFPFLSTRMPAWAARLLATLWRGHAAARRMLPATPIPRSFSLHPVLRFDSDIDAVWQRYATRFRFSMTRDADYLNWRFVDSPIAYESRLLRDGGQTVGCIVFRSAHLNDEPVMLVCEVFALADSPDPYLVMLAEVQRLAIARGAARIGTMNTGCAHFKQALDRLGYVTRPQPSMPVIGTWVCEANSAGKLYDRRAWHLSPADADFEHALFDQMSLRALQPAAPRTGATSAGTASRTTPC